MQRLFGHIRSGRDLDFWRNRFIFVPKGHQTCKCGKIPPSGLYDISVTNSRNARTYSPARKHIASSKSAWTDMADGTSSPLTPLTISHYGTCAASVSDGWREITV